MCLASIFEGEIERIAGPNRMSQTVIFQPQELLFELPSQTLPKCKECGKEFEKAKGHPYQIFCSKKCKLKERARVETAKEKRVKSIGHELSGLVPRREPKGERDKEIVRYFDEGFAMRAIAHKMGITHRYVLKRLVLLGCHVPDKANNRRHLKGRGPHSRNPNNEEIQRRKKELELSREAWRARLKINGELQSVKALIRKRRQSAVVLRNLKKGIGFQTTCKQNGWSFSALYEFIRGRKSYRMAQKRTGEFQEQLKTQGKYTKQFRDEYELQGRANSVLAGSRLPFKKEPIISLGSRRKPDFTINEEWAIEAKCAVRARETATAIGQAAWYRSKGYRTAVLIPDDITIDSDSIKLLHASSAIVLTITEFPLWVESYRSSLALSARTLPPVRQHSGNALHAQAGDRTRPGNPCDT
jgi:hypothetical protein